MDITFLHHVRQRSSAASHLMSTPTVCRQRGGCSSDEVEVPVSPHRSHLPLAPREHAAPRLVQRGKVRAGARRASVPASCGSRDRSFFASGGDAFGDGRSECKRVDAGTREPMVASAERRTARPLLEESLRPWRAIADASGAPALGDSHSPL